MMNIFNQSSWTKLLFVFTVLLLSACQKRNYLPGNAETFSDKEIADVALWYNNQLLPVVADTGFVSLNHPDWSGTTVKRVADTRIFTTTVYVNGTLSRDLIVERTGDVYTGIIKEMNKVKSTFTIVHNYTINGRLIEEGFINATGNYHMTRSYLKNPMGSTMKLLAIGGESVGGASADIGPMADMDPSNGAVAPDDNGAADAGSLPYFVYTGTVILYYDVSTTTPSASYAATSGNIDPDTKQDYRNSAYQSIPDFGPVPEGLYSVNLTLDPNRFADHVSVNGDLDGELYSNFGIQQIATQWTSPVSGETYTYEAWGTERARLRIISGGIGRDNFYLHNSHKGYSHGCIEVNSGIFTKLLELRAAGKKSVGVRVKYAGTNIPTIGATYY